MKRISCEEWEKLYHSHNAFICLLGKTFLYNRQKIKADYQNKAKNWEEKIKTNLSFTTLNVLIYIEQAGAELCQAQHSLS